MTQLTGQEAIVFSESQKHGKPLNCLQVWNALPMNSILWYSDTGQFCRNHIQRAQYNGLVFGTKHKQMQKISKKVFFDMNLS